MFKEIKNLIGFLTIIPVGMDPNQLTDAAGFMFLFPLVGAFIGLLGGIFAWVLWGFLPSSLVGVLTLGVILFLTGLHHTDGLFDFGDGLMSHGSAKKKIEIMHDPQAGAGGVSLGLIVIMATVFSITQLRPSCVVPSLIISEVSAKLSMVLMAWGARSGHKGMNTIFVEAMHDQHRNTRLITALLISFILAVILLKLTGITVILTSLAVTMGIIWISNRHFNGVTGDVFGAGNEITRLASLIALLVVTP